MPAQRSRREAWRSWKASAARIGPRLQLTAGPATAGAGLAMLALATSGSGYVLRVLPAVVVLGLGLAITTAPLTAGPR